MRTATSRVHGSDVQSQGAKLVLPGLVAARDGPSAAVWRMLVAAPYLSEKPRCSAANACVRLCAYIHTYTSYAHTVYLLCQQFFLFSTLVLNRCPSMSTTTYFQISHNNLRWQCHSNDGED